jgi:hypothetical protein
MADGGDGFMARFEVVEPRRRSKRRWPAELSRHQIVACVTVRFSGSSSVAQHLKMRGKPHKLVIIAIARRLVTIANAILKKGVPWRQNPVA